jgi:hypothetical protein
MFLKLVTAQHKRGDDNSKNLHKNYGTVLSTIIRAKESAL